MNSELEIKGLAKRLVADNLLNHEEMLDAFTRARQENIPLTRYLVKNRILASSTIADTASRQFGLPKIDLTTLDPLSLGDPGKLLDVKLIKKHHILPLQRKGNLVSLAISDPSAEDAINEIKFSTGASTTRILRWTKVSSRYRRIHGSRRLS